jgi:hypothetical protein
MHITLIYAFSNCFCLEYIQDLLTNNIGFLWVDRYIIGSKNRESINKKKYVFYSNVGHTVHGEEYSVQHYVIKFVSDLRQVVVFSGFLHQ